MVKSVKNLWSSYRTELIIFVIALPYLIAQSFNGGDFRILLRGAEYLCRGVSPYGIVMPIHEDVTDVLLYSPFVAFVIMPFTYLPEFIPTFIFNVVTFLLLYRLWDIMVTWLQINNLSAGKTRWWYVITIVFIVRFIMHNFENSQMNILVLYLSLEGLYQIFQRGKNMAGILIAIGICLKVLPIIFLPYLVYRGKVSASAVAILCCFILLLLPSTWFGFRFDVHLLQGWWAAINPTLDKYNAQQNTSVQFHCISALIPVYFSDCSYRGFTVNMLTLSASQVFLLINAIRGLLLTITFYFLWVGHRQSGIYIFWELSYIFLLIPLIFPHQAKYSYVNLLPAYGYVAHYLVKIYNSTLRGAIRDRKLLLLSMGLIAMLTIFTADVFWGMTFGKYFQFLKLITVGTLILIPVLAFFSPKRLDTRQPHAH